MNRRWARMVEVRELARRTSEWGETRSAALVGHEGAVLCVALSRNGRIVASGGRDRTIRAWDTASARCLRVLRGHTGAVTSVVLNNDGSRLLSGSTDGTAGWWDLLTGQCERFLGPLRGGREPVTAVALGTEQMALVRGLDAKLHRIDLSTGEFMAALPRRSSWLSLIRRQANTLGRLQAGIRWPCAVGRNLVLLGNHCTGLEIRELSTGRLLTAIDSNDQRIHAVALSEDGRRAVAAGSSATITMWDTSTARIAELKGHTDEVSGVCLSPNGTWVLSSSWDGSLRLWEKRTGRCLRVLAGHECRIHALAWIADRGLAASAGADGTVSCWHIGQNW